MSESRNAANRLLPLVYEELRQLAGRYLAAEGSYRTLQPTALVHEAYLRLVKLDRMVWTDKKHFLAMAATQMRRVLIERARAAGAQKRGARPRRVTLSDATVFTADHQIEMLALDRALRDLAQLSERQSRIAEMRVFSGMRLQEIAELLDVSERTVRRDWRLARAWLARELRQGSVQ